MSAARSASSARLARVVERGTPTSWRAPNPGDPCSGLRRSAAGRRRNLAPTAQTLRWIHDVLRRRFRRVRLCRRGDPAPPRRPSRLRGAHRHGARERRPAARRGAAAPAHATRTSRCRRPRPRRSPATTSCSSHCRTGQSGAIAAELAPETLVIDCGADHRLERSDDWAAFYGGDHHGAWSYGVPELPRMSGTQRDRLTGPAASPPPAATRRPSPCRWPPASAAGVIEDRDLVSVLAVGPSGAGRSLKAHLLASEILGSANPYSVGGVHRHIPEITQALRWAGRGRCPRSRSRP